MSKKRWMSLALAMILLVGIIPMPSAYYVGLGDTNAQAIEAANNLQAIPAQENNDGFTDDIRGLSVRYGEKHFYIQDGKLFNVNQVIDENGVNWVVLHEETLYWSNIHNNQCNIYKLHISDNESELYYRVLTPIDAFDVYDNNLYFLYDGELTQVDMTSGREKTLFIDHNFRGFYIDDSGDIQICNPPITVANNSDDDNENLPTPKHFDCIGDEDPNEPSYAVLMAASNDDINDLSCDSFISDEESRKYVEFMLRYYLTSESDLDETLKNNKPVIFFFEGASDNSKVEGYDWATRRVGAVCIILKYNSTEQHPYISYYNDACSTLPSYPLAYGEYKYSKSSDLGTATLVDGIYSFSKLTYHGYPGLWVKQRYTDTDSLDAIYMKRDGSYIESPDSQNHIYATEICVHYRTSERGTAYSPWSAGCILVGEQHNPSSGSYKLFTDDLSGITSGKIVIDRHLAKQNLNKHVYHNSSAVSDITLASSIKAGWISTYTCGEYRCTKNPETEIRVCKTPDDDGNSSKPNNSRKIKIFELLKDVITWPFRLRFPLLLGVATLQSDENQYIYVLGTLTNYAGKWYMVASGDYIPGSDFEQCFEKVTDSPGVSSEISLNLTRYPTGQIPKKSYTLAGTISSTCNIDTITGSIYDKNTSSAVFKKTVYVGSRSYSIAGGEIDRALKFGSLSAASNNAYYLEYIITDITGNTVIWPDPISDPDKAESTFHVYNASSLVSMMPYVSVSTIENGQRVNIGCTDSNALIHYTVNGSNEKNGHNLEEIFLNEGTYNIDAWTTKSGYAESAHNIQTISVARSNIPLISDVTFTEQSAYVTIIGSGRIFYTLDGSTPSRSSRLCDGPIYLNGTSLIRAMSIEHGKEDSEIASKEVTVEIPATPSVYLYHTKERIAVGKSASVSWERTPMATSYSAYLYKDGQCVETLHNITGNEVGFVLRDTGLYEITVNSKNFLGVSAESSPVTVEAMAPVTLTVVDHIVRENGVTDDVLNTVQDRINSHDGENAEKIEGNVISIQTVDYDSTATRPSMPSKKGFDPQGYSFVWTTPITQDTTVYAEYGIKYYDVAFWNYVAEGSSLNHLIGNIQRVMYTDSATVPMDGYTPPTGYKLAGWNVDNTSQCFDFTYVDGDMKLNTSYTWENRNLPAILQIANVIRDKNCTSYNVSMKYINCDFSDTQARLIVSLYTADNRMVYTQVNDVDLDKLTLDNYDQVSGNPNYSGNLTLNYSSMVSRVTAVLVQVKDDRTGGAVSEMVSSTNIEGEWHWSAWSDWSTEPRESTTQQQVEQKLQYRYRTKEFTTSSSSNLDGWSRYDVRSSTGDWSAWSSNNVDAFENDSMKREVNRRYIEPIKKTQYHYFRFYLNNYGTYTHKTSKSPYFEECWVDSELPFSYTAQGIKLYTDGSKTWIKFDGSTYGGQGATQLGLVSVPPYFTREVQVGGDYWEYQYRDTHYTYYYWKWGNWSEWNDSAYGYSDNQDVETRTVYRHRDYILDYDQNRDIPEEESIISYLISGRINGLTEDYSGKRATVLVYKKTNSDPTQEQLEYVDQVILGDNNSYSFAVNPKEEPLSQTTGDFIVTLSIEGCSRLVNVDVIEAVKPTCTVTFISHDGNIISQRNLIAGTSLDVNTIEVPTLDGFHFVKWDTSLINIDHDLTVSPVFEKNTYPVVFVDHENETVDVIELGFEDPIPALTPNLIDGKVFTGWDGIPEDGKVHDSVILTASWTPLSFSVCFHDLDGETIGDTQQVEYGKSAVPPDSVVKDGVEYSWETNGPTWWCVTQDIDVHPYVPPTFILPSPMSSVPTNEDTYGLFNVELFTENETDTVYYTIDVPLSEMDALQFINDLTLTGTLMDSEEQNELSQNSHDDHDGEYVDLRTVIQKYTDAFVVYEGSTIYAFSTDTDGNLSPVAQFSYNNVSDFYDDDLTTPGIKEVMRSGDTIVASINNDESGASIVCVVYDESGKFIDLVITPVTSQNEYSFAFEKNSFDTAKVFLLDSNLCPLCECKSVK